jgi:NAD(P)-dependent dehydrogenase (short-subunit alcohol dehydrogenase family)
MIEGIRGPRAVDTTKVAVVTGASSGIGKETAKALACLGWRVIALGRDPARSAVAEAEICAASVGGEVDMIRADLASMADTVRAAREIAALTDRIDVLVNNAGGVAAERHVTAEGNEGTFAGNHLGPFLLTDRLLPLLRAAAKDAPAGSVRIINTSSLAHESAPGFDWTDPQMLDNYSQGGAYCNAKLANVLFTRLLARRLAGDGIVSHAMHPGVVDSNFTSHADASMQAYMNTLDLRPPAEAADTLIWLATAEEPGRSSGNYYHLREAVATSAPSQDMELAERLWRESETLIDKSGGRNGRR